MVPYALVVGSFVYAMVATQLDIVHVVRIVSRFIDNLDCTHQNLVTDIISYLVGAMDLNIKFALDEPFGLVDYMYSYHASLSRQPVS